MYSLSWEVLKPRRGQLSSESYSISATQKSTRRRKRRQVMCNVVRTQTGPTRRRAPHTDPSKRFGQRRA